jgi:5-hydroxyisourate hydrolase
MSQITTHVLDTSLGKAAVNVPVLLELQIADAQWKTLDHGVTDTDGRLKNLLGTNALEAGTYRLIFNTGVYFGARGVKAFYPQVIVTFEVTNSREHYHVPLLLSPYGYSTYRGS